MGITINVLIAGDSADEAATIAQILQSGAALRFAHADGIEALGAALSGDASWDLVVCCGALDITAAFALAGRSDLVFVMDEDSEAVLAVLKVGGMVVLRDRLMDLADKAREIGHRKALSLQVEEDEARRTGFEHSPAGMAQIDLEGNWLKANAKFCEMTGMRWPDLSSQRFHAAFHREELAKLLDAQARLLAGRSPAVSTELRLSNGHHVDLTLSIERETDGRPGHLNATIVDIGRIKHAEQEIAFLSKHDMLSGLPNRGFFLDSAAKMLAAGHPDRKVAIMILDIDRFNLINDALGHEAGDGLIKRCAQQISECLDQEGIAARSGSDEFMVALSCAESDESISLFSRRLLDAISSPFRFGEIDLSVTGSMGIAFFPDDGDAIPALLKKAGTALQYAKTFGRNHHQLYRRDMSAGTVDRLMLENDLRHALERNEFELRYQPQVDLATGRMNTIEALLRWNHPTRGSVAPSEFIQLAEEAGLIDPIGKWVLDTACRQARDWSNMGMEARIAVNLSAVQFYRQDLVESIADALNNSGLSPECLELEITENAVMRDAEEAARMISRLKRMGIRISIDDFGTGYSSLSYLRSFAIDKIKIDQSFVDDIASDPQNAALTNSIIALAHSISLSVTAEGVENPGQLALLSACDSIQGFYFYSPMSAESITAVFEARERLSA